MRRVSITHVSRRLGVMLAVAVLLSPSLAHAAPARVTLTDLGRMIVKSLAGASSFQVMLDTSSGAGASSSRQHITEYFVRRGNGFVVYAQLTMNGKTSTMVDTGKHLCMRPSTTSAWNCTYPTSLATRFLSSTDIANTLKSSGTSMQNITDAGAKTVQGQSCLGYNFTAISKLIHFTGHGVYWFSTATGRIVEMTEVGSIAVTAGTRGVVSTTTVVYSRWNDPSIKLPAVPAS